MSEFRRRERPVYTEDTAMPLLSKEEPSIASVQNDTSINPVADSEHSNNGQLPLKLNRTLVLLMVGLVIFEIASAMITGMTGIFGVVYTTGISYSMTLIRFVNIALCVLLVTASLFADKIKRGSIVPIACCAVELVLSLVVYAIQYSALTMIGTAAEVVDIAGQGIRTAGLGMLIGMVLAITAGLLIAKKRIILPLLVMAVAAVLSIVVYFGMTFVFTMGLAGMFAVGFFQPFAFLFPAFAFGGVESVPFTKKIKSTFSEKPTDNKGYSYLEAYKNKHK